MWNCKADILIVLEAEMNQHWKCSLHDSNLMLFKPLKFLDIYYLKHRWRHGPPKTATVRRCSSRDMEKVWKKVSVMKDSAVE